MKHFTMIAKKTGHKPRACAILQSETMEKAAESAKHLVRSQQLMFVESGSLFAVRASSRREIGMMRDFLSKSSKGSFLDHRQEDIDSLIARRAGMLLAFFIGLYLNPKKMREDYPGGGSIPSVAPAGGAGGEISIGTAEEIAQEDTQTDIQANAQGGDSESSGDSVELVEDANEGTDNLASHTDAVLNIVQGGASGASFDDSEEEFF